MKNREILVVQGEAVVAVDLEWQLNRFGYRCAGTVGTGAEAIIAAQRLRPDLILMDADLPGSVTGLDAAVTISEKLGIPVVLITSFLDEIMEAGQEAFFPFGYIVKPFESRELKMVVDSALHRRDWKKNFNSARTDIEVFLKRTFPVSFSVTAKEELIYVMPLLPGCSSLNPPGKSRGRA